MFREQYRLRGGEKVGGGRIVERVSRRVQARSKLEHGRSASKTELALQRELCLSVEGKRLEPISTAASTVLLRAIGHPIVRDGPMGSRLRTMALPYERKGITKRILFLFIVLHFFYNNIF